jgi:hypothetical protein
MVLELRVLEPAPVAAGIRREHVHRRPVVPWPAVVADHQRSDLVLALDPVQPAAYVEREHRRRQRVGPPGSRCLDEQERPDRRGGAGQLLAGVEAGA